MEQIDAYLLIEHTGSKMDDRLVVAAGVEHKHMSASDLDETLGYARPYLGIPTKVPLNGPDRALNVILKDRDRIRDRWFDQFLVEPLFKQSAYDIRLGVTVRGQVWNL